MERRARGGGRSGEQLIVLAHRIIPCLDVADGRVVKGTRFVDLRDAGDPVELARRYSDEGADELVFLDISASSQRRGPMLELVERIARAIRIPFTIGGGIASADDVVSALEAGADKVSLNTAIVLHPELVTEAAERAGSQAIVAAIDAKRAADRWEVWIRGGRERCYLDAVEWACELARLGAGELLVTSIDRDGSRSGYDVELLAAMAAARLPLIASGGAGELEHLRDAVTLGGADAILVASIVHDGSYGIADLKRYLLDNNITVRP